MIDIKTTEHIGTSSDRSFGFVFTVVFLLISAWPVYDRGEAPHLWAGGIALVFFLLSLLQPRLLAPLNRLWTRFGLLLNRITSPIILGLFFFVVLFPIALIMRLFGKRPLELAFDKDRASYWIEKEPAGPEPESMKHQF
ncbi:MAG: hypothetical protein HQL67_05180 [Magnetococcales bacterium]|nr:hypothetical protein [Magnetococcales bacterium]